MFSTLSALVFIMYTGKISIYIGLTAGLASDNLQHELQHRSFTFIPRRTYDKVVYTFEVSVSDKHESTSDRFTGGTGMRAMYMPLRQTWRSLDCKQCMSYVSTRNKAYDITFVICRVDTL